MAFEKDSDGALVAALRGVQQFLDGSGVGVHGGPYFLTRERGSNIHSRALFFVVDGRAWEIAPESERWSATALLVDLGSFAPHIASQRLIANSLQATYFR